MSKIYMVVEDTTDDGRGIMGNVAPFTNKVEAEAVANKVSGGAVQEFNLFDSAAAYHDHELKQQIQEGWRHMPANAKRKIVSMLNDAQRQELGL